MIDSKTGLQQACDGIGKIIRPFDPRITGRYNYDNRMKITNELNQKSTERLSLSPVDLPRSLA
jgi:hypothetical protein